MLQRGLISRFTSVGEEDSRVVEDADLVLATCRLVTTVATDDAFDENNGGREDV
jgi:hypothetical protein